MRDLQQMPNTADEYLDRLFTARWPTHLDGRRRLDQ